MDAGGVKDTVAWPSPAVAATLVGAPGTVAATCVVRRDATNWLKAVVVRLAPPTAFRESVLMLFHTALLDILLANIEMYALLVESAVTLLALTD